MGILNSFVRNLMFLFKKKDVEQGNASCLLLIEKLGVSKYISSISVVIGHATIKVCCE